MLERIHLENFKSNRNVDVRLTPLTVLTGMNGSGKSTLLQSIGLLRQSYDANGNTSGLSLGGDLAQLGQRSDVLSEGAESDALTFTIWEDRKDYRWISRGLPEANLLRFEEPLPNIPKFLTTPDFQFLQANRILPQTLYPQAPQQARDKGFLGARGEFTADFLAMSVRSGKTSVRKARRCPKIGIGLDKPLLQKVSPVDDALLDQVAGWLQQLSPGVRIAAELVSGTDEVLLKFEYVGQHRDVKSSPYRPTNVGFGLTYSLPILVACLAARPGALLLIENPEAHLHPQGQAALGELLARCAGDGVQIIAETHSDHLLNGVRLAVKKKLLKTGDVTIHFFSRSVEDGEVAVQSPVVDQNGKLSEWPVGFFDQWDRSLEELLDD